VNAVDGISATSASLIHCCSWSSKTAFGWRILVQASWLMEAMAAVTARCSTRPQ
jgi:hypothetical protein